MAELSPFTVESMTFRGEYAGTSTNANGDMTLKLYVDRGTRMEAVQLGDLAGMIVEFKVFVKPKARARKRHDGLIEIGDVS